MAQGMEYVTTPSNWPPSVGKLTPAQIATRSTWANVPDARRTIAAMHVIHVVPDNGTTVTDVNPLDPGTLAQGWLHSPGEHGRLTKPRSIR